MLGWIGEFFKCGHSFEYLNEMSYWDFLELTDALGKEHDEVPPPTNYGSDKVVFHKLKPAQKLMIQNRIKQREKEGIRSG